MNMKPVTPELLEQWTETYVQDPLRQLATLALARNGIDNAMTVSSQVNQLRPKFSVEVETLPVTNQQRSGRCWLFAATNVLREKIAKELKLEQFELSQSWLAFWDKFERANYFLESILDTAALPTDDRTVQFILTTGVHDGGQWDMFANIVRKYGLVPKDNWDETYQSSNTGSMNYLLNRALKAEAVALREMAQKGVSQDKLQAEKNAALGKVYAFLCSCYGKPVEHFDFEYVDKDKQYHIVKDLTPKAFCERYVGDLLEKTVSIINAPTADKPYDKVFTVRYLGNVVGGKEVRHLNLRMEDFKAAVIRQLQAGKVVWFGSDVAHWGDRDKGRWDDQSFNASLMTGLELAISKEDSLNYWFAAMNHAMVLTGVNLVDGKPNRWKIENSWGDDRGEKGYYICSDSWFDQYVFQAAVEREYLGEQAALADQEAIELAPWDPMGTLAD